MLLLVIQIFAFKLNKRLHFLIVIFDYFNMHHINDHIIHSIDSNLLKMTFKILPTKFSEVWLISRKNLSERYAWFARKTSSVALKMHFWIKKCKKFKINSGHAHSHFSLGITLHAKFFKNSTSKKWWDVPL